jgi:endogenous inhibitor of DNA gyrase (YacG/DUF329 family)
MPHLQRKKGNDNSIQYCVNCGKDVGFSFVIKKFCNAKCINEWRKKVKYHRKYRPLNTDRKCLVCEKPLVKGERKKLSKFCSKRCMNISTRVKDRGQKYITVKIPIKDIPRLFK